MTEQNQNYHYEEMVFLSAEKEKEWNEQDRSVKLACLALVKDRASQIRAELTAKALESNPELLAKAHERFQRVLLGRNNIKKGE